MRCLRLFTGADGCSHVEEAALDPGMARAAREVRYAESPPGAALDWHVAPTAQYVVTLEGVLEFVTPDGESFLIRPGDVLIAEDTSGSGHRWRLVGDAPWRRLYVVLAAP